MIAGKDAVRHGEAKNSWLTGTAAWNFVAISQYLLGVRPDYEGLRVQPCIGSEVAKFTVTRKCRGAEYQIRVKNSGKGGAPKLTVDGKPVTGNLVPYAKAGRHRHRRLRGLSRRGQRAPPTGTKKGPPPRGEWPFVFCPGQGGGVRTTS